MFPVTRPCLQIHVDTGSFQAYWFDRSWYFINADLVFYYQESQNPSFLLSWLYIPYLCELLYISMPFYFINFYSPLKFAPTTKILNCCDFITIWIWSIYAWRPNLLTCLSAWVKHTQYIIIVLVIYMLKVLWCNTWYPHIKHCDRYEKNS